MTGDTRACFKIENKTDEAYFFHGKQYARIGGIKPGTTDDHIITGPKETMSYWPSLKKAGFSTIDCVLPIPGDEAYFFCNEQYVRVGKIIPGTTDDYIITGPKKTMDFWPSLKKCGFEKIDAVMPIGPQEAYFFCGHQYARIAGIAPGTTDDHIVTGPKSIVDYWPSLKKAEFKMVDNVLPISLTEAYFFCGEKYVRIDKIVPGQSDDHIVTGPKDVAGYWPSLKKAGFY